MDHMDMEDFSCEIDKPLTYLSFILEYFGQLKNRDEHGRLVLDRETVSTFTFMLGDARGVISDINKALYPE